MDHPEMEEDGRMSGPPDDRLSEMDQEELMIGVGDRDSPLKHSGAMEMGEDILAKLRQQVSAASLFAHHNHHGNHLLTRDANNGGTPTPGSPNPYQPHTPTHIHNNNNNINNGHNLYDRLHTLLQAKIKRDEEGGGVDYDDEARELALRAEAIQRQRESLLSSPHTLMNAMRVGPHPLLPPTPHLPFLPSSVGLPPSSQMPPTPGSAGSRDSSSGNGNRTPSHTPEPSQSQQPWSFEDQFKQVRGGDDYGIPDPADSPRVREPAKHSSFEDDKRKLYELSSDSKRKDFLDELFGFMQKRGTPINRLPIMAKQVLDLYELYNLVVERGGLVDVINKKLWQEIIKGLKLPSSITSAAFTLRTQYMKYLYPFECEKKGFSNPTELQCAIDGNRREGRRSSYGTYGDMGGQPPLLPLQNFQSFQGLQNPLSLVSRPQLNGNGMVSQDLLLGRGGSPPGSQEALLEATRLTMWKLYNQGLGSSLGAAPEDDGPRIPPPHLPMGGGGPTVPPQKEALNLDVKDDVLNDSWSGFPRGPPRNKDNGELRHSKSEEGANQPPSAKRPHDEPLNQRLPTPNGGSTSLSVPGANIKITSRGDGRGNDQSLVVSMEINGILYQGVLFSQPQRRFS